MDNSVAAVLGAVLGAGVVAVTVWAFRLSEVAQRGGEPPEPLVPPGVAQVLSVIRSSAVLLGEDDRVLKASAPAYVLGLVRGSSLQVEELAELVRQVRRDGQIRERELVIGQHYVAARVAPLSSRLVLALVDDRTSERRVESIRRDFVANVSHELKTPVGALQLLAEAVEDAADDPQAVARFASRMQLESDRLSRLVQQIIELSRLQGDDVLDEQTLLNVDDIVAVAVDRSHIDAEAKGIDVQVTCPAGLRVRGNRELLRVAVGNLVENAVTYSPSGSRVVVSAGVSADPAGSMVEISVADQGIGIPASEIDRIFERFYRVDPARARTTGGTGLGLSIVKHVAASHGGDVRVWSVEGEGSSFTLRLPAQAESIAAPVSTDDRARPRTATA